MKFFLKSALTAALLASAASASAQTITFEVSPLTLGSYSFRFSLDPATLPNFVSPGRSTRFNGTPFTYTRPNGQVLTENGPFDGPSFFPTIEQGGIAFLRLDREPIEFAQVRFFGPQLYTGTEARPIFRLGTFDLSSQPRNAGDPVQPITHRITISQFAAPVPEPATWATMILGLGAVGAAARRRRAARALA